MTVNLGSMDRALRALIGLILIAAPFLTGLAIWQSGLFFYGALIVGAVLLGTAAFKFCPAYRLLGIKTCPV